MKTFKEYLYEEEQLAATPAANVDIGEKLLDIKTTPEVEALIDANTVRDADGDVDMAASFGQMMTKTSKDMDVKGLQDALAQVTVKLDNFEKDPQFLAASPEDQAEFRKNLPQIKQTLKELVDGLVKLQQQLATGGQQMTDLSKTADYQNPMKGVKSFVPQRPAATPAPVQESADDKLLKQMLSIAGLKEADAPAAAAAPAPTTTAIVPASDVDPAETALKSAQVDPQLMQQVEANTVRDAEGDVDLSATFQKIADQIPVEPQIRAEWAKAFKQFDEKFSHIEQDPEFMKMTPEEQVKTKQDVQEVRALFQEFMEFAVQMSNTVKSGAQQVRTAMAAPGAQNPLKGVKTLTPPVQETADDKLLKQMLSIAGLR